MHKPGTRRQKSGTLNFIRLPVIRDPSPVVELGGLPTSAIWAMDREAAVPPGYKNFEP